MPDVPVRVEFLRKSHLFRGLSEMELLSVAEAMGELTYPEPAIVIEQGKNIHTLYFVFSGRVVVTQRQKEKERKLSTLMRGDYFGEKPAQRNGFSGERYRFADPQP
jgi:CRP-like cAMP-binding protein